MPVRQGVEQREFGQGVLGTQLQVGSLLYGEVSGGHACSSIHFPPASECLQSNFVVAAGAALVGR